MYQLCNTASKHDRATVWYIETAELMLKCIDKVMGIEMFAVNVRTA